jgi:thioredoxin reductase (NADPH)
LTLLCSSFEMVIQNEHQRPEGRSLDRQPFLLETDTPRVFIAGVVPHGSINRIAAALGEGSTAFQHMHQYLLNV